MYSTLKWSDNFRVVIKAWDSPGYLEHDPRYFCRYIEPKKKLTKKYFIKKEMSIGKSKLSNFITAHL